MRDPMLGCFACEAAWFCLSLVQGIMTAKVNPQDDLVIEMLNKSVPCACFFLFHLTSETTSIKRHTNIPVPDTQYKEEVRYKLYP